MDRRHIPFGAHYGTYVSWRNMKKRCYTKSEISYPRYGGAGITVCEQWQTYQGFLADMGERPEGFSLDRINGLGNYEPGNCRWATRSEQNKNRRQPIPIRNALGQLVGSHAVIQQALG